MTTQDSSDDDPANVRVLGGEIWAALHIFPESALHWQTKEEIVELVMSVLARHDGEVIRNDRYRPVAALPRQEEKI